MPWVSIPTSEALFLPVLRIHDIWCGSGSGANPLIFVIDLQEANKKLILKKVIPLIFVNDLQEANKKLIKKKVILLVTS
jgi:hypothetical protein